ncbi:MAG: DUF599 domain-containing protein [Kangiellaceae bacterium]|jgi:uncharacterized membrane protein|nr:DUF599 domain-containing protein [Kangiellaceae bacterium]
MLNILPTLDWIAFGWFLIVWFGYSLFANYRTKHHITLSIALAEVRANWIKQALNREMRMADVSALGILQRNVTFFASTTMFILAGLLTVLGAADQAIQLLNSLPFVAASSEAAWEFKLLVLVIIFVYAFFKFAWSMRQYNFALVVFGSAPAHNDLESDRVHFVNYMNQLLTRANNSFAYGLRGYSFAMAVLAWFIQPWLFILATTWVLAVLYRRDFISVSLEALKHIYESEKI